MCECRKTKSTKYHNLSYKEEVMDAALKEDKFWQSSSTIPLTMVQHGTPTSMESGLTQKIKTLLTSSVMAVSADDCTLQNIMNRKKQRRKQKRKQKKEKQPDKMLCNPIISEKSTLILQCMEMLLEY